MKRRFPKTRFGRWGCTLAGTLVSLGLGGMALQASTDGANPCAANPCAAIHACAAANPCAANPCAANPCAANPCAANPCAADNPCAANPCAADNPCEAANPCAADDPAQAVKRPEGYTPGYSESGENAAELLAQGEALFNDTSLSGNGLSCASCHEGDQGYQATFEQPYPHPVAMGANRFGMETVHADEMVQMCMVVPMAAEALGWDSEELAALSAYVVEVQRRYSGQPHNL